MDSFDVTSTDFTPLKHHYFDRLHSARQNKLKQTSADLLYRVLSNNGLPMDSLISHTVFDMGDEDPGIVNGEVLRICLCSIVHSLFSLNPWPKTIERVYQAGEVATIKTPDESFLVVAETGEPISAVFELNGQV